MAEEVKEKKTRKRKTKKDEERFFQTIKRGSFKDQK